MIDHTTAPELLEGRANDDLIRGNAHEVETTLDACLQIHRWDRAMTILAQLRKIYAEIPEQMQRLYNKVLEAMVFDHIWNRSAENIARINGWVENDMKKAGVKPNAHTFALKIKAAMSTLSGRQKLRTVRRYWDMAKEYNVDWEVASLRGILSDSDLGKLSEISPLEIELEDEKNTDQEDDEIAVQEDLVSQPALPDVLETPQKGLGMPSLRRSLSLFNDANHLAEWENVRDADPETREAYAQQRQTQLERDALASATDRWKLEHEKMMKIGITGDLSHGKVGAMLWSWHEQLTRSIEAELEKIAEIETNLRGSRTANAEQDRLRLEYGPFLRLLPAQTLAALTTMSVISLMVRNSIERPVKLSRLVTTLGRMVEKESEDQMKQQREVLRQARWAKKANESLTEGADQKDSLANLDFPQPGLSWSVMQYGKVGSILCELLFDVAKMGVGSPTDQRARSIQQFAFERRSVWLNGKRVGTVSARNELCDLLTNTPVADLIARHMPMVCKPRPWSGYNEGGYLEAKNDVLRVKHFDVSQKLYAKAAAERGDLDQVFKGLDVLAQTGWRINQEVFKVMLEAWNTGEEIANLAPMNKVFAEQDEPAEDASPREKYHYFKHLQMIKNEKGGLHSQRCFQNFQMEVAKAFSKETFYLPHNVDFRGRAYPIPPYLNQMGADNSRGLLMFADGRPLGEKGFEWLKIHLANVCGYDKASLRDRAQYVDTHIVDIRDSAENPLSGKRWWLRAEDPWQCLATCFELIKAIDSGDPHSFVSYLPIHQDGTCNGLQHYAALGGDMAGARQVNLEPGAKPADVYTGVAELVKAEIKRDTEQGNRLAKELDGKITRKIVKQTVMTNVYGVTFVGARAQVKKQLEALWPELHEKKLLGPSSTYIAKKIFKGLGSLFEGAHAIQSWFGDCAVRITSSISPSQLRGMSKNKNKKIEKVDRRISRELSFAERKTVDQDDFRSSVVWTTPLKLPVVQPYRVAKANKIKTHMASITLKESSYTDSVDRRKQLQAFPPNFIHSLDATHMMLSALKATEHGLTFTAVHDSFWTHAADIDDLNLLLRDAFIRMHSEDIVGRLAEEFKLRYKDHIYLAKVDSSSKLGKQILDWRKRNKYTASPETASKKGGRGVMDRQQQFWELEQEHVRQTLLSSEDPVEAAKGEQMETPASIFNSFDGEQYLVARNTLGETALGSVPKNYDNPESTIVEEALKHNEIDELHDVDLAATLEPVIDYDDDFIAHDDALVFYDPKKGANTSNKSVWLWLPLTFKPVPKKGDWDVRRLKDSVYFFS